MSDTLTIEHNGKQLQGQGRLKASTSLFRIEAGGIERPLVPYIEGEVVFAAKTSVHELMDITDTAVATCRRSGEHHAIVFKSATVMQADPMAAPNGFTIKIMGLPSNN